MNTNHYGGKTFKRNIRVYTNDPDTPTMDLNISGDVERFATIVPDRVRLSGYAENEIRATVKIIPEKKYAFKIVKTTAQNGKNISYELMEKKREDHMEYFLNIAKTSKKQGRYFDTITLETDSKISPTIRVKVFGNIMEKNKVDSDARDPKQKS